MTKKELIEALQYHMDDDEILIRMWNPNQEWPIDRRIDGTVNYYHAGNTLILVAGSLTP